MRTKLFSSWIVILSSLVCLFWFNDDSWAIYENQSLSYKPRQYTFLSVDLPVQRGEKGEPVSNVDLNLIAKMNTDSGIEAGPRASLKYE